MLLAESASGTEKARLNAARVDALAVSPDGQTIAFSAENRIRLWIHAKKQVAGGEGAIGSIRNWDISPDGHRDKVVCGNGVDTANVDDRDRPLGFPDCETVN